MFRKKRVIAFHVQHPHIRYIRWVTWVSCFICWRELSGVRVMTTSLAFSIIPKVIVKRLYGHQSTFQSNREVNSSIFVASPALERHWDSVFTGIYIRIMPSTKKTLFFLSSTLATALSIGVMGFSMSTVWAETTMECSRGDGVFNGTGIITFQLFVGIFDRESCPLFTKVEEFEMIPQLTGVGVTSVTLHALVIFLLVLCLLFSAISILISAYNSVSNPYETYMGPIGVYVCSSVSACLSAIVLILFVLNIKLHKIADVVVENLNVNDAPVDLRDISSKMLMGYYLIIPYTVLSLAAIGTIYMYDHTAYKHRREQERPTEDAPKEIMMY
ncbi:clarin-3 [Solea senegalensis]|uniref:Clarin-3 n=1 Tax=Solea senegalensis TaxID=28829 RepID=A0AAV6RTT1_SOLSE|nr:clarin-3 [Solea senegalensis]KAG7507196.1 clarin-3 [Solea senegalensis]